MISVLFFLVYHRKFIIVAVVSSCNIYPKTKFIEDSICNLKATPNASVLITVRLSISSYGISTIHNVCMTIVNPST